MIKDVLQSIANVEIYPIIALILFFISFLAVTIKVLMMDKTKLAKYAQIPLEDNDSVVNGNNTPNNSSGE
jgi:hypothetical protein